MSHGPDHDLISPRRSPRGGSLILAIALSLSCVAGADRRATTPSAEPDRTRTAMHELFAALGELLPPAVSGELGAPEQSAAQAESLAVLRRRSGELAEHGGPLPPGARLLATALEDDATRAETFFSRGAYQSAAFLIARIVDDCSGCHSRLPSGNAPVSAGFVDSRRMQGLDGVERAEIAAATRQFDRALELFESAFRASDASPEILLSPLTRYLIVSLRVARDPGRAAATIGRLARRDDLPPVVARDLAHWHRALEATSAKDLEGTTVAAATAALERAEGLARHGADRRPLVEFLVASTQANDLAAKPQDSPQDVALLYELLGRAEQGIAQNIWSTRADLYWETAIRLSPGSPAAKRAFESLETEIRAGYTGSSGLHLPDDEAQRIEALRALVSARPKNIHDGAELFAQHCALCHGADALGRGPLAGELMWNPADLTSIAARNDGEFPRELVFERIARRDPLAPHQSPQMPRWGKFWVDDSKIDALVTYLESIQVR